LIHSGLAALAVFIVGMIGACGSRPVADGSESIELLNVSYDPTRELWKDINSHFIPRYEKQAHVKLVINQSHGGSSSQARSVIDGLKAQVVTLALWSDTDAIRKSGLIKAGWEESLPNHSLPYWSTIVFVVRKGNPKGITNWSNLVRPDVQIVTPNPKTSGNGKLSFLAAWGSVVANGGSEQDALDLVGKLYQQVPVLDSGARGATKTFAEKGIGDVHLTWENEAQLEVHEAKGELELVYPTSSIRAEPYVAIVDANLGSKAARAAAEAYLNFLYTDEGQQILAKHFYRPFMPEVLAENAKSPPDIKLFSIADFAGSWDEADKKFFASGGVFDSIYETGTK